MQPLNVSVDRMLSQASRNLRRDLPMFIEQEEHGSLLCIVGGAPSLKDSLPILRSRIDRGALVASLNGTHDWLIERGIVPNLHVMLDARQQNVEFVRKPHKDVTYMIAAQCHPDIFDALEGHDIVMWVADLPGMRELVEPVEKPVGLVGGGSTVGMKTMMLAYLWGFRAISLFGIDGCYRGGQHHAYAQPLNDGEQVVDTIVQGKRFSCSPWMLQQADDFDADARNLIKHGVTLKAYGSGLIQTLLDSIVKETAHASS